MGLGSVLRRMLPRSLKSYLRGEIVAIVREHKAPRMIYGYRDSSGAWRPRTRVSDTVYINNPEQVRIGDNVYVGHFAVLDGTRLLEIGEGTQIGAWVGLFTHSSHFAIRLYGDHYLDVPEAEKLAYQTGEIRIGRYVFIGSGAQVAPGVTIGDGAIIAAGARVKKNVKPFSLVTEEGKEIPDAARRLDAMNLNTLKNAQLAGWYREWQ